MGLLGSSLCLYAIVDKEQFFVSAKHYIDLMKGTRSQPFARITMIVRDIMTTKLITVEPDDSLGHAINLLRQHQIHQLPVTRMITLPKEHRQYQTHKKLYLFEGMLTSQDVDVLAAQQNASSDMLSQPWQERRVSEVMHRASIRVTPTTSVATAAQILVERGLSAVPVVEYDSVGQRADQQSEEMRPVLLGLLSRSDLLLAFARAMGAYEPGMQLQIELPLGNMDPLAEMLQIAAELHVPIRSLIAAPLADNVPLLATVRMGTINPTPLLVRLQKAGIQYSLAPFASAIEGENHA